MPTCEEHNYIYSDGFEVCSNCGICTTMQEYTSLDKCEEICLQTDSTDFEYILINNNIGYGEEVKEKYNSLFHLRKSFTKKELYAYSVYTTLLDNGVYYSLANISSMFALTDFVKKFCKIKTKLKLNVSHSLKIEHFKSCIDIFIHKYQLNINYSAVNKALENINSEQIFHSKPNILMAAACASAVSEMELICQYFGTNERTVKRYLKCIFIDNK